jgi:hypothetical protein
MTVISTIVLPIEESTVASQLPRLAPCPLVIVPQRAGHPLDEPDGQEKRRVA